ncbi:MAG TPA: hypothetical protein PLO97_02620, partial [Candidatus Woesebacteria bacterium]|nr:hypothetical protein [Candidatus Woesebacteria bacterium]
MQNSQDNSVSAIANSVDSKLKSSKSSQEENQSKSTTRVIKRRVGGKSNAAKAETDQASNSSENMNGRSSERSSE